MSEERSPKGCIVFAWSAEKRWGASTSGWAISFDKMRRKLIGEMCFSTATNYFFAVEEFASEPYEVGDGHSHVLSRWTASKDGDFSREAGCRVRSPSKTMTAEGHDYRIAFVVDQDGYRVDLIQRGTMKVGGVTSSPRCATRNLYGIL